LGCTEEVLNVVSGTSTLRPEKFERIEARICIVERLQEVIDAQRELVHQRRREQSVFDSGTGENRDRVDLVGDPFAGFSSTIPNSLAVQ
jgi:hypothetical protein